MPRPSAAPNNRQATGIPAASSGGAGSTRVTRNKARQTISAQELQQQTAPQEETIMPPPPPAVTNGKDNGAAAVSKYLCPCIVFSHRGLI